MARYARSEINEIGGYYAFSREIINGDSVYDFDETNWDCTKLTKDELNKLLEKIEDWETLRKELKEFLARY